MPGSAGHSPLQPREAAKEMLTGHVVSQEPEIDPPSGLPIRPSASPMDLGE